MNNSTKEVWEVKYINSALEAQAQALGYVGGLTDNGYITSLGAAGAFNGYFVINCMGHSFEVNYFIPSNGVVLYSVRLLEQYDVNTSLVYTPKRLKQKLSISEAFSIAISGVGGFALAYGFAIGSGGGHPLSAIK